MTTVVNTFQGACALVVKGCPNPYARAYAEAGLGMIGQQDAEYTQALYILCNIGHWRGQDATAVRKFLNEFTKVVR